MRVPRADVVVTVWLFDLQRVVDAESIFSYNTHLVFGMAVLFAMIIRKT